MRCQEFWLDVDVLVVHV